MRKYTSVTISRGRLLTDLRGIENQPPNFEAFRFGNAAKMASKQKLIKRQQNKLNTTKLNITFEPSSIDSTLVEEKLFGQVEDEASDDGPVVFICGKCKLPVGDSMSWDGSEDGLNQIRLKRVTENVVVGKENRLYEADQKSACLIMDVFCRGCQTVLGMVYVSTPKNMDHKRFAFCFNVADIDSYVLGSASQMLAAEGPKEQPVTLEYRGVVQQQLSEMKMFVLSMAKTMEKIEATLREECDDV